MSSLIVSLDNSAEGTDGDDIIFTCMGMKEIFIDFAPKRAYSS